MGISMESIPAGEFKAKCLGLIEEVHESGKPVIVTKRGEPMVIVVPYESVETPKQEIFGSMKDTITITGDIMSPIDVEWDADK